MDLITKLSINLIVGILVVWLHEIPKYYLTLFLTRPAFRQEVKIKGKWKKCIDPIALITFVFLKVGWQMPLKIDATKLTNKKHGLLAISISGFLIHLIAAGLAIFMRSQSVLLYSLSIQQPYLDYFITTFGFFNIVIFTVNLLPVPPLDMTKIVYALSSEYYFKILQAGRMLQSLFIVLLVFDIVQMIAITLYKSLIFLVW